MPDERARLRAHRRPARGRRPACRPTTLDDADVVVLNTCCIRENADNKLYGNLGQLKALKAAAPGPADRRRRLPGPEGPRARPRAGAARRRRARHPQRPPGRRAARTRRARPGPITEILEEAVADDHDALPLRAAGPPRERRTAPGSRSRSAATTVRLLHRARGAGPRDQPPVRRHRRRGRASWPPTASPRSRCSARTSTATAATSRWPPARPAATTRVAAAVRRPAAGRRRRRRASAGCATPARTPRTCGPRPSRPWPRRRRCASTCTCRCRPAATGCWPPCTAATPPSATSSGWPRPGRAVPDLAVTTDIIVGFPGETDDDFERTLEVVAEAEYDSAYTFIFSPPARHRGGRAWSTRFVARRRRAPSASSGCGSSSSGRRCARHRGPGRSRRGGAGRGPEQARTRRCITGRTGQNKLVHFRRAGAAARRAPTPTVEVTGAAPHHLTGELRRGHRRAARTAPASRWPPAERRRDRAARCPAPRSALRPAAAPWRSSGRPASGKSALALAVGRERRRDVEIVVVDSMQVYRGMDIGTAKPTPAERAEVPPPLPRPRRPRRGLHRRPSSRRRPTPRSATSPAGAAGRCWSAAPGCTCGRSSTASTSRASGRTCGRELEAEPDTVAPARRGCAELDPVGRRPHGADQPAPGRAGPRGHASAAAGRSRRSGPASTPTRRRRRRLVGLRWPRPMLAERIEQRFAAQLAAGFLDEVERLAADPGGLSRTAAPGPRLQGAARPPRRASARSTRRSTLAVTRTRQFAVRQERWFRRDPRIRWLDDADDDGRSPRSPSSCERSTLHDRRCTLTKHHGLGNDFLVLLRRAGRRRPIGLGDARPPAVRPPPRHRRRRAARRATEPGRRRGTDAGADVPTSPCSSTTPTAAGPR